MIKIFSSNRRLIVLWSLAVIAVFMLTLQTTPRILPHARTRSKGLNRSASLPKESPFPLVTDCACTSTSRQDSLNNTQPTPDQECTTYSRFELNRSYQVNVSNIDITSIEDTIFGDTRSRAETFLENVSASLMTSGSDKLTPYYKNHSAFVEADRSGIIIGNYTYSAGGRWRPTHCKPKWKVAIVIPYRDRIQHLAILLRNLHHLLMLQNLEFGIFVAEQTNDLVFNRGLMKNIGYMESTNFGAWDCVIFHDIDQIPMRATNWYGCDEMPRHLCAYAEELGFKLMYGGLFGGVVGLTAEQMKSSNGYSNVYWGWGAEDDDLRSRVNKLKYKIYRASGEGYYKTLKHKKKSASQIAPERFCLYQHFARRMEWDGINHTRYNANVTLNLLFTHIAVDVQKEEWNTVAKCKK
ncbi:beta-1,4-galactosyltransferase 6 isoform X1 [Strongylocentrotus purpuratus]|uniref:Beta-1,4-galactosyltransferase n=1 Tax=Strongylocentrotus purpuratus TaxID=7668 RepID=A0A7M7LTH7_STRPU|nr:beta-1,4-galactosyltransferase 6 isoform X1 [Strongylocentrotus purpuratus]